MLELEIEFDDERGEEVRRRTFQFRFTRTHKGHSGRFSGIDGGDPPEADEFDISKIYEWNGSYYVSADPETVMWLAEKAHHERLHECMAAVANQREH